MKNIANILLYVLSFFHVVICFFKLYRAEVIVIMEKWGFGHTIQGSDVARRFFKGKKIFFVIFQRRNHNRNVSKLWKDITVYFIPFIFRFRLLKDFSFEADEKIKSKICKILIFTFKRILNSDVLTLEDLYDQISSGSNSLDVTLSNYRNKYKGQIGTGILPFKGRMRLYDSVKVPKMKLFDSIEKKIRNNILCFAGIDDKNIKFCCLYIRNKDVTSGKINSIRRSGSNFEKYTKAIHQLIDDEYLVLLVGDRIPDKKYIEIFNKRLIWEDLLNIKKGYFSLFAGTSADIWIGNSGGAYTLPEVNQIPFLMMEAFPFYAAPYKGWIYFKLVKDKNGKLINYKDLLSKYTYNYYLKDLEIVELSEDNILDAVKCFINNYKNKKFIKQSQQFWKKMPDYTLGKFTHSVISPAYLENFVRSDCY